LQPFLAMNEVISEPALGAKELAVDAGLVAVVRLRNLPMRIDRVVLQPSEQWVQIVPVWFISHGRDL